MDECPLYGRVSAFSGAREVAVAQFSGAREAAVLSSAVPVNYAHVYIFSGAYEIASLVRSCVARLTILDFGLTIGDFGLTIDDFGL